MTRGKNDLEFNAVTEEEVQAEAERAYLQDDSLKPEIPQELEEKFQEIVKLYDEYARAANLEEKDIEEDKEILNTILKIASEQDADNNVRQVAATAMEKINANSINKA